MKTKSNKRETLRIRLYSYFEKYKKILEKSLLYETIYDIINRFESRKNAKHQSGGGRQAKIFNKQAKKILSDWSIKKIACHKEKLFTHKSNHNTKVLNLKKKAKKTING